MGAGYVLPALIALSAPSGTPMENQSTLVYTAEEVATLLKLKNVATVRRLIARRKLTRVPFIRHIRVTAVSVERFLNSGTSL